MRLSVFILTIIVLRAEAQIQSLDISGTGTGASGFVKFNDPGAIGQKSDVKVDYSDVRGSCFWDNEWRPAVLILKNGQKFTLEKVKLNFYTNDVHYLDGHGVELIAENGIREVVFFNLADSKVLVTFQSLAGFKSNGGDAYTQILSDGNIKLLKRTEVALVKKESDPMASRPDLRFLSNRFYYIQSHDRTVELKSISKESLFSIILQKEGDEAWLALNKNKLKKEADLIAFIAYRNSTK